MRTPNKQEKKQGCSNKIRKTEVHFVYDSKKGTTRKCIPPQHVFQMCHADMFAIDISPCISFLCAQNKPVKLQSQHQNAFAQYRPHIPCTQHNLSFISTILYTFGCIAPQAPIRINYGLSVSATSKKGSDLICNTFLAQRRKETLQHTRTHSLLP